MGCVASMTFMAPMAVAIVAMALVGMAVVAVAVVAMVIVAVAIVTVAIVTVAIVIVAIATLGRGFTTSRIGAFGWEHVLYLHTNSWLVAEHPLEPRCERRNW